MQAGTIVLHYRSRLLLGAPKISKKMSEPHDVFDRGPKKSKILRFHPGGSDCPLKPGGPNDRRITQKKNVSRHRLTINTVSAKI